MLTASDSFIKYLQSELTGVVSVNWVRQTPHSEHSTARKQDALNVELLGFFEDDSLEYGLVSLDLLGSDERTVLGQAKAVRDVLLQEQFTTEYDWANPSGPIPTGRTISWERNRIRFIKVRTPQGARVVHYNCSFPLIYTRE